ncbi:MAG: hypothetical protein AB1Y25_12270 [Cycloclasticus sp.]
MTLPELAAIAIALLSLLISLLVIVRDRRHRQIDVLYQCNERLRAAQDSLPITTVTQEMEIENNPNSPESEEYSERSRDAQSRIDRELEFACFMVEQKQVDLKMFFYLFKSWLAFREKSWRDERNHWKAKNHPFTTAVLVRCRTKGLLPIKDNKEINRIQNTVNSFISHKQPSNKTLQSTPKSGATEL